MNEKQINTINKAIAALARAERTLSQSGEHMVARDCREANSALVVLLNEVANEQSEKEQSAKLPGGNKA